MLLIELTSIVHAIKAMRFICSPLCLCIKPAVIPGYYKKLSLACLTKTQLILCNWKLTTLNVFSWYDMVLIRPVCNMNCNHTRNLLCCYIFNVDCDLFKWFWDCRRLIRCSNVAVSWSGIGFVTAYWDHLACFTPSNASCKVLINLLELPK